MSQFTPLGTVKYERDNSLPQALTFPFHGINARLPPVPDSVWENPFSVYSNVQIFYLHKSRYTLLAADELPADYSIFSPSSMVCFAFTPDYAACSSAFRWILSRRSCKTEIFSALFFTYTHIHLSPLSFSPHTQTISFAVPV